MTNKYIGSNEFSLTEKIKEYYAKRQLKHPNIWEALGWAHAEFGEVYEVLMSMSGGWIRNNPENHPEKTKADLSEELGDVIFMLVVAGIEEGLDPIASLEEKMQRKLKEKKLSGTSSATLLSEDEINNMLKEAENDH